MADSVTLTVRLPGETKTRLAELAGKMRRTSSFLAAEVIADYVARELAIVEAIEQGRREIRDGAFIPHAEVAQDARDLIQAIRTKS